MREALRPYAQYERSRHPWIERIPSHWEERRAKFFFREVDERSLDGTEELLSVSHLTGVTPRREKNVTMFKAASYVGHKLCRRGDLVINTMWAWMGALGVAPTTGIISPSYGVYRPIHAGGFHPEYLDHLLRTRSFISEYICRSTGIRASRLRLYPDQFLDIPVLCPPREEQDRIAAYLRASDSRFRRIIRKKQRLITLLNEQKQAIIQRTVTRGLDPGVRLKPSGVEWLGEVPEHWEVRRLKHITSQIVGGATPSTTTPAYWDGDVVWVTPKDVSRAESLYGSERRLTQAGLNSCSATLVPAGSIIITSRAPVGNVAQARVPLCTNQGCKAIVPARGILDPDYGYYLIRSMQPEFQCRATGTTFAEISTWDTGDVAAPLPPLLEQEAIARSIRVESRALDAAVIHAFHEIDLFREYRSRLVVDVVTGKLDVRHVSLPAAEGDAGEPDQWEGDPAAPGLDDAFADDDLIAAGAEADG